MSEGVRRALAQRIDTIEEAYEFFLAYAAQGLRQEVEGSKINSQLRSYLHGMSTAVAELSGLLETLIQEGEGDAAAMDPLEAFRKVMAGDADRTAAALDLVRAQPFASSQLVDNLNASVHVRALLTDLFLLDEVLNLGVDLGADRADADTAEERSGVTNQAEAQTP